jgi:hypothetical protein
MTLMASDADYAEVMAALLGDLAPVPWQRPYQLPTATVPCTWREAADARPLEELQDKAAGRDRRRGPGPRLPGRQGRGPGRGLDQRVADPSSGHPGEPPGIRVGRHRRRQRPYPQLRELRCAEASTCAARPLPAARQAPRPAAAGTRATPSRYCWTGALKDYPQAFTAGRIGSWTGTFPAHPASRRCSPPAHTC